MNDVVDADVVEETALATRPTEDVALFHTDDPVEVLERATRVANALKDAVDRQGLIKRIQGKDHPLVEAWQTLGSMLGITAVCVATEATTDRHGKFAYKATMEARWRGEVVGRAEAMCSTSENRWAKADDYAILSMAQTRATSKALKGPLGWVMKLAGYESTPAEEMQGVEDRAQAERKIDTIRYHGIVDAFQQSTRTPEELAKWLGVEPTDIGPGVAALTWARADELEAWLAGGGE